MKIQSKRKCVLEYIFMVFLAIISAMSYHVFIFKNSFAPAGINGIATLVQYMFNFSVGYLSLIINIPLAIMAFFMANKSFAVRSMLFVIVFSAAILVFEKVNFYQYDANGEIGGKILAVIAAGAIGGIVYGYSLKINGSTGGTDFAAAMIHEKHPQLSVVWLIFGMNSVVAVISFFVYNYDMEAVILCEIYCFILTRFSDVILKGFDSALKVEIITDKPDSVIEELLKQIKHGITEIKALGVYSNTEKHILVCLINKRELVKMKRVLTDFTNTFAYVSSVNEIYGTFMRTKFF